MIGLLVVGGYLAIAACTWRVYVTRQVEYVAQKRLAELEKLYGTPGYRSEDRDLWIAKAVRNTGGLVSDYDRSEAVLTGALAGLFWLPFWAWLAARILLALATQGLTSPTERAFEQRAAERAELEALRKLAREHNLPMPGGDT